MMLLTHIRKQCVFFLYLALLMGVAQAQQAKKGDKKYPSILWEITGKGMTRPSYLFGTMHVSNKMVFNLGDSFYHAIEQSDYVGLELDPGYWQEYFSSSNKANMGDANPFESLERRFRPAQDASSLTKGMFAIAPYEKKIERAITMEPTIINSLLYRKSQNGQEYEEDTYLDMYLYQICKKLNKKIAGLEVMETSEKMSKQAMLALQEGKGRRSTYDNDEERSTMSLEDAYKSGDLDMLDSMNKREMPVPKFRSIFIDKRNEIQANSIDSIIRLKHSIFAGVGAAHLPGANGVIEELRKKGYRLRPVKLNNRNSLEKDRIDKIHYPVQFATRYTADSVVKADIPGNWYRFRSGGNLVQYSDLANGSYYILTRVPVDALFWGHTQADVLRKIDSMLYENIPGKMLTKTPVTNSGYSGYDITNRTRRGDRQRYQIFATPFEVIIAKMSGSGDYVANGTEATTFFNSIRIKTLEKGTPVDFMPSWGAFSVKLPHQPYVINRISGNTAKPYRYEAADAQKGIQYCIMKETRQRSKLLEEDTFELKLLSESYASSKMVEKETGRKFILQNGYPAMEATYQLKDNQYSIVRYLIQGPHYYAIIAQQKGAPFAGAPEALTSFRIQPFQYNVARLQTDSIFGFSFTSPVPMGAGASDADDIALITAALPEKMASLGDMFRNYFTLSLNHDSTGEAISISGIKFPPYAYIADSTGLDKMFRVNEDDDFVVSKINTTMQKGWKTAETWYTDTASSRLLHTKTYYKQGVMAALKYYTDTLTGESPFAKSVFSSFMPADTLKGANPFEPKGPLFFKEYASTDSTIKARAIANLSGIKFRKEDLPMLKKSMSGLTWDQPAYLGLKKRFINALGDIREKEATSYLKDLYVQANDTAMYQQQVLNSLLNQRTLASFKTFEDLITSNPPVEIDGSDDAEMDGIEDNGNLLVKMLQRSGDFSSDVDESSDGAKDWGQLTDTMQLTQKILPGLLNLLSLDDYKEKVQELLNEMTDSSYVTADVLQPFYTKFLLEAKQEYKKALVLENETAMKKKAASLKTNKDEEDESSNYSYRSRRRSGYSDEQEGHEALYNRLVMLTPFYDKQATVRDIVRQAFNLKDEEHGYKLMKMLIRKDIKAYPDTLIPHFAADPAYRSRLYEFLYNQDKLKLFPKEYNESLELAKSRFRAAQLSATDTLAYVGQRSFTLWRHSGTVYFFKYRAKKSETWKWGMVEMVPSEDHKNQWDMAYDDLDDATGKKLDADKTVDEQMDKLLKEKLNSKRLSAYEFYGDEDNSRGRYSYYGGSSRNEED